MTTQPREELVDWMVWLEGWDIWKELHEVDALLEPISRTVEGPVPDVEAVRTGTMTDSMIISPDRAAVERDFKDLTEEDFEISEISRAHEVSQVHEVSKKLDVKDVLEGKVPERAPRESTMIGPNPEFTGAGSALEVEVLESKSGHTASGLLSRFVKRNFTRYKKQLKIEITGKDGQTFVSYSKDISVGGILLTEPLPRWVVGYLQVKIVDKKRKQAIEVTCSVVEDQDPNYRVRLEILPLQKKAEEVHFDKWLAA